MLRDFDHHIHIGQFNDKYFQPHSVIETLHKNGIKGCWFSSTTSCLEWLDNQTKDMLISHVRDEIMEALETAKKLKFEAKPLYWVIPKQHKDGDSISEVMTTLPYAGFKIHPRAHNWNMQNKFTTALFTEICNYALVKKLPIIIHTGESSEDNPIKFIKWFVDYPDIQFILAHCRPIDTVIQILKRNKNLSGDSSFVSEENLRKIKQVGLSERILFGTDYPVNTNVYK